MYSSMYLYGPSSNSDSDSDSDNSTDTQTNRKKYFRLIRQVRNYLGDEKIDYPDDLVYCLASGNFQSESKMRQDGVVSKFIRHQPFREFIQMLKKSAAFLATDTEEETEFVVNLEETEQLTIKQEKALKCYLIKDGLWELTGKAWIQKRYGKNKTEEIEEY